MPNRRCPLPNTVVATNRNRGLILGLSFVVLLVVGYTTLVVAGYIPPGQRIDAVHLALILVAGAISAFLVKPDLVDRLRAVEFKGLKIELLERLQERQIRQEHELEDIRLIIPLLFRERERKHLINIMAGRTAGMTGGQQIREELRRLCSIELLRRQPNHRIRDLHSDQTYDLADYVEITDFGRRWVHRLSELDPSESDLEDPTNRAAPNL
jgi:hypothetical protein